MSGLLFKVSLRASEGVAGRTNGQRRLHVFVTSSSGNKRSTNTRRIRTAPGAREPVKTCLPLVHAPGAWINLLPYHTRRKHVYPSNPLVVSDLNSLLEPISRQRAVRNRLKSVSSTGKRQELSIRSQRNENAGRDGGPRGDVHVPCVGQAPWLRQHTVPRRRRSFSLCELAEHIIH